MRREWLELAVAASAGVAAEPPTAATSPAVASATFACGVIAAVATTVVSAIAASVAASIASSLAATPADFTIIYNHVKRKTGPSVCLVPIKRRKTDGPVFLFT